MKNIIRPSLSSLLILLLSSATAQFVYPKNGSLISTFTDVRFPNSTFVIDRTYDSKSSLSGIFGSGWSCLYDGYVMTVPGKAVGYYEDGSPTGDIFINGSLDSGDLAVCIDKMVTIAKEEGKVGNAEQLEKYRNDLLQQDYTRNRVWGDLVRRGKVDPLQLPVGTELTYQGCRSCGNILIGDSRHFMTKTLSGYLLKESETISEFDGRGKMIRRKRPCESLTIRYDDQGRISRVFDDKGNSVEFTLDENSKVIQLRTNTGRVSRNVYDENGLLLENTDADGYVYKYTYDDRWNMLSMNFGNNSRTIMKYFPRSQFEDPQLISYWDGGTNQYTYMENDETQNVTIIGFDSLRRGNSSTRYIFPKKRDSTEKGIFYKEYTVTEKDSMVITLDNETNNAVSVYKDGITCYYTYDTKNLITKVQADDGFSAQVEYFPGTQRIRGFDVAGEKYLVNNQESCNFSGFILPGGSAVTIPTAEQDAGKDEERYRILDRCIKLLGRSYLRRQLGDWVNGSDVANGLSYFKYLIASNDTVELQDYGNIYLASKPVNKQQRSAYLENAKLLYDKFVHLASSDNPILPSVYNRIALIEIRRGRYLSAERYIREEHQRCEEKMQSDRLLPLVYLLNGDLKKARSLYEKLKDNKWTFYVNTYERDNLKKNTFREIFLYDILFLENDSIRNDNFDKARRLLASPVELVQYYIKKAVDQQDSALRRDYFYKAIDACKSNIATDPGIRMLLFRAIYLKDNIYDWSLFENTPSPDLSFGYADFLRFEGKHEPDKQLRRQYFEHSLQLYQLGLTKKYSADYMMKIFEIREELFIPNENDIFLRSDDISSLVTYLHFLYRKMRLTSDTLQAKSYLGLAMPLIEKIYSNIDQLKGNLNDLDIFSMDLFNIADLAMNSRKELVELTLKYAQTKKLALSFHPADATLLNKCAVAFTFASERCFDIKDYTRSIEYRAKAVLMEDSALQLSPKDTLFLKNQRNNVYWLSVYYLYDHDSTLALNTALRASNISNERGYCNTLVIRSYLFNSRLDKAIALYDKLKDEEIEPGNTESYKAALIRQLDALEQEGLVNDNIRRFRKHMDDQ